MEPMDENQTPPPALSEPATTTTAMTTDSSAAVAPVWHTLLLVAGIAVLSIEGARELAGPSTAAIESNRFVTYATSIGSESLMLAWVWFGLRLRKVPFRSLFGDLSGGIKSLFLDLGIAAAFWVGAMMVLMTAAVIWLVTDSAIHHRPLIPKPGQSAPVDPSQQHTVHTLAALAPSNGLEIAAWALVCVIAGLIEELVFRGYLLRQFTAWSRGAVVVGVFISSVVFGAAHGYQGARNMVLLTLFGSLFALLAVLRRNLRAGMFAHAWHDFIVGLALSLLKWKHLI